jgi:hypothetical protein
MLTIEYTHKNIENEPGPNFYWRGKPLEYLQLLHDLHSLGVKTGVEISLDTFQYIQIVGVSQVLAKSSVNGKVLCQFEEGFVYINLTPTLWRQLIEFFLKVSFYPSHDYIEFAHVKLVEHANFIISSEA